MWFDLIIYICGVFNETQRQSGNRNNVGTKNKTMNTTKETFTAKINFTGLEPFEQHATNVVVEIENNEIVKSSHELSKLDKMAILILFKESKQVYNIKDKSGRNGHYETTKSAILNDDEFNDDDEFMEWLDGCDIGQTYTEFNNQTITRTK